MRLVRVERLLALLVPAVTVGLGVVVALVIGSILTAGMMLDFLGWKSEGESLRNAVRYALQENFVTPDLGGDKATVEVGDWIAKQAGSR